MDPEHEPETWSTKGESEPKTGPGLQRRGFVGRGGAQRALVAACTSGDVEAARRAVENGADLERPDIAGWRPLHRAAAGGHRALARWLLEHGVRPDRRSVVRGECSGATPLHVATVTGHPPVMELLLMRGASADARDEAGLTPLHIAALQGRIDVVRTLLKAGAEREPYACDLCPLDLARQGGHRRVAALLRQVARRRWISRP